eukprot:TRINITY_DN1768_c0_g2_i18.p1 TRINITY_DN1768_c0_g2~~TRINITY_DN1768_c0_g2_i18.p1  ORF type:complete len:431 (+),score=26.48 TRINITY_DN1768_c0_g2_i18:558-1850(+)
MDDGWVRRINSMCKSKSKDKADETLGSILDSKICLLNKYDIAMGLFIGCGSFWIIAAIVIIISAIKRREVFIVFVIIGFLISIVVFFALFPFVRKSLSKFNKECLDHLCTTARKHGKKSSSQILALFITVITLASVSFVMTTVVTFALIYKKKQRAAANSPHRPSRSSSSNNSRAQTATNSARVFANNTSNIRESIPPKRFPKISAAGKEFIDEFRRHNKYICHKDKMQEYVNKKFLYFDIKKVGSLSTSELIDSLTNFLRIKGMISLPSDRKIAVLMQKYDANKAGIYKMHEFRQILFEVFLEPNHPFNEIKMSVMKYAEKKAKKMKPKKILEIINNSLKMESIDRLLKNSEDFYEAFEQAIKEAGNNVSDVFDIDGVVKLINTFCRKYGFMNFDHGKIVQLMADMQRSIIRYDIYDLHMAAYAVFYIT